VIICLVFLWRMKDCFLVFNAIFPSNYAKFAQHIGIMQVQNFHRSPFWNHRDTSTFWPLDESSFLNFLWKSDHAMEFFTCFYWIFFVFIIEQFSWKKNLMFFSCIMYQRSSKLIESTGGKKNVWNSNLIFFYLCVVFNIQCRHFWLI
jgi:hypothetical protein